MDFDRLTGSPISAKSRLQFNIFIRPVEKLKIMKNFPEALFPLFWVEEGIDAVPEWIASQIRMAHTGVKFNM